MVGIQCYSSGFTKVSIDEDTSLGAVHWGHSDRFVTRVSPVQVVLEPVQSQAHRGLQGWIHQWHLLGGVIGFMDEGTVREEEGGNGGEGEGSSLMDGEYVGDNLLQTSYYCKTDMK